MKYKNETTRRLIDLNGKQSRKFVEYENESLREFYREKFSIEILVHKCSDGRLSFAQLVSFVLGVLNLISQVGSFFDLGDSYLSAQVQEWIKNAMASKKKCLVISTYHFSKGDKQRGCAGHNNDTQQALMWAKKLVNQYRIMFGDLIEKSVLYPIVVGMETDSDGLIFHGDFGKIFSVTENINLGIGEIELRLAELYPRMPNDIRGDLTKLVLGNFEHVKSYHKKSKNPLDLVHRESSILVGEGCYGWMRHNPNIALVIGPYNNSLFTFQRAIVTAGGIVLKNIEEGRVSKENGVTVMCTGLIKKGTNYAAEVLKAILLHEICERVLMEKVPRLGECNLEVIAGVIDKKDFLFHGIDVAAYKKGFAHDTNPSSEELDAISSLR